MDYDQISPYLSHLRPDDLQELINLYYGDDFTVAELLEMFEINISAGQLVAQFPPYEDYEVRCPFCDIPMLRKWTSRTTPGKGRLSSESFCRQCGHQNFDSDNHWCQCSCQHCLQKKHLLAKQKEDSELEKIREVYGTERKFYFSGDIMEIDLKSAIYLLAMERQSISGEIGIFSPQNKTETPLTPDIGLTIDTIKHLSSHNYIRVDPVSPRDSFVVEEEGVPYYITRVQYFANLGSSLEESKANIQTLSIAFRDRIWPSLWRTGWMETIRSIWQDIALYDCLQYLTHLGQERDFEMPQGDKTKAVLTDALSDHPTSVVYQFIWSAVVRASDYYQANDISKKQAANSIVGNIQRHLEKVRLGAWEPRPYGRYKNFRPSALYETLFNHVLQIGDDGFNKTFNSCLHHHIWIDECSSETNKTGETL